jgi:aspartyl-tRNA(Asn)/glutamyl-tRNA(Gln) amidotransferase subunit A
MNEDWLYLSAIELSEAMRSKQISPVELMEQSLCRLEHVEPVLNCFATVMANEAMESAKNAEKAIMAGDVVGPLHGLPVSIKDLVDVNGIKTAYGSRVSSAHVANFDAPSVERLKAAGACIVGKTTSSEFGCMPIGNSPLTGITRNPWNLSKTPGGSSCGAASSVAAGVTPFSLGTDGGGSVRIPASFTGLFGIKPQFGRVPIFPCSATPTLAHIGALSRSVRDGALLLEVMSGHDSQDCSSLRERVPNYVAACEMPIKGMRIAWSPTLGYAMPSDTVMQATEAAVDIFRKLGCEVTTLEHVMEDPYDIWSSEFYIGVATRLRDPLSTMRDLMDPAVVSLLEESLNQNIETYYTNVFKRYALRDKMRYLFEEYDLLLTPTLPVVAFDVGVDVPPELPDRNVFSWVSYTYPFNLTGQPAASIPCGFSVDNLPVGLQIVARCNGETDLFRAAAAYEAARPWAHIRPRF